MLFATSFGEFVFNVMLAACLLVFCLFKIITTVDSDGEIKTTARKSIMSWLERWLK